MKDEAITGPGAGAPGDGSPEALTPAAVERFRQRIYRYYQEQGRQFPWRQTYDPYSILVSEIMLQQTQVERVVLKYEPFLARFPDFASLARAQLREVMEAWQGLGYNRRALALQRTAGRVISEFGGRLPQSVEILRTLPGIGPATTGALAAFAFHQPVVFIETNIRRVFIHCFFADRAKVRDQEILPLVAHTLDRERPRPWYYALMDYGAGLKRLGPNANRRSALYQRQSPFADSDRQIRGLILQALVKTPALTDAELLRLVGRNPMRTRPIIDALIREGFLERVETHLRIAAGPSQEPAD
ncbi:MAG: A/G-specific adenine glycosylase [Desulfobaccales bacterium]